MLLFVNVFECVNRMFLDPQMTPKDKWFLTNVAYGAQADEYDFHFVSTTELKNGIIHTISQFLLVQIGFFEALLAIFLKDAGFCDIERVGPLNIGFEYNGEHFSDTSHVTYKGYILSLNMVAKVCPISKPDVPYDKFNIDHNAIPYLGDRVEDYPPEARSHFIDTPGLIYQ